MKIIDRAYADFLEKGISEDLHNAETDELYARISKLYLPGKSEQESGFLICEAMAHTEKSGFYEGFRSAARLFLL